MVTGVVGLGLIGGSLAKAYKQAGHTVYGYDTDESVVNYAGLSGVLDGELNSTNVPCCDMIHLAASPPASLDYLEQNAGRFSASCLVIDHCGTKRRICERGFDLAAKYGFTYVGGHPMAGTQFRGYKYSRANMFSGATMIVIPPVYDNVMLFERIKEALGPMALKRVVFTTAENHDRMIAYTSQLPHIISNAYAKSPLIPGCEEFSAGSFRDLTRVARLNESMWAGLFLENKDNLLRELGMLIDHLGQYKKAMEEDNNEKLVELLKNTKL